MRMRSFAGAFVIAWLALGCARLEPISSCAGDDTTQVLCGFQNPEDLAAAPGGEWIVVSQFPRLVDGNLAGAGSLLALRPSDGERRALFPMPGDSPHPRVDGVGSPECGGPPDLERFSPHGIDLAPAPGGGARLVVVNHGGREAIEWFRLELRAEGPAAFWEGCVPLPEDAQANDVALLPDGSLVASNMVPREAGVTTMLRIALGWATGELLAWDAASGWRAVPGTRESAPNGVTASADGATLYFAAWGGSKLVAIGRDGSGRRELALPHHPDNLTWTSEGHLLVAGQKGPVRHIPACGQLDSGTCPIPFSVVRVGPADLSLETLYDHDPARLGGAASVALDHAGALWIGTFAGDRILRVTEAP